MRIDVEDLTYLLPGVLSSQVRLERHRQVLISLLIGPSDDGLSLAVVLDVGLDYFILEEINRVVLF